MRVSRLRWRVAHKPPPPREATEQALCRMLADNPKGLTVAEIHHLTPRYGIPHKRHGPIHVGRGFWGNPIYLGDGKPYSCEAACVIGVLLRKRIIKVTEYGRLVLRSR